MLSIRSYVRVQHWTVPQTPLFSNLYSKSSSSRRVKLFLYPHSFSYLRMHDYNHYYAMPVLGPMAKSFVRCSCRIAACGLCSHGPWPKGRPDSPHFDYRRYALISSAWHQWECTHDLLSHSDCLSKRSFFRVFYHRSWIAFVLRVCWETNEQHNICFWCILIVTLRQCFENWMRQLDWCSNVVTLENLH